MSNFESSFNNLSFSLIIIIIIIFLKCDAHQHHHHHHQHRRSTTAWNAFFNVSNRNFVETFLPRYIDFERDVTRNDQLTDDCRRSFQVALRAVWRRRFWAIKMFNSWATFPPSGTLRGTLTDFGDYDQCLISGSIITPINDKNDNSANDNNNNNNNNYYFIDEDDEGRPVSNQYCLLDIAIPMPRPIPPSHNYYHQANVLPPLSNDTFEKVDHHHHHDDDQNDDKLNYLLAKNESKIKINDILRDGSIYRHLAEVSSVFYYANIQIGVCVPAACSREDVAHILRPSVTKLGLELVKQTCETEITSQTWQFDLVQSEILCFFLITIVVAIIATLYDRFISQQNHKYQSVNVWLNWLRYVSPARNIRKLFTARSSEDDLACVHGMRVLTIAWIVAGHSVNWNALNSFRDTFFMRDRLSEMLPQPLYRGIMTVDTFFYLSGLLTSYVTIKYTAGKYANFNSTMFVVLRYLRLTPQLAIFIAFTIVLPELFNGPIWRQYIDPLADRCRTNWWLNLLYVQNLIDPGNICGLHTWYLAADMQLHCMSLLPIIMLLRNRSRAIMLIRVLIIATIALSSVTIFVQKLPPGSVITSNNDFFDENMMPKDYLKFVYKPLTHAHVFLIGFLFGDYLKHNAKAMKKMRISKWKQTLLWLCAFGCFAFSIYSTVPWLYGRPYDPMWSAIIFPLNQLTWSASMTIVIWLCVSGNGASVGRFLSAPVFRSLSRTTYSVYLTHVWIVWIVAGARRDLIDLHIYSILLMFCAVLTGSFVLGIAFTVLYDTPIICMFANVKKCWFQRNPQLGSVASSMNGDDDDAERRSKRDINLITINSTSN